MEGDAETLRARCEAPHTSETLTALVGDEAFLGSLRSSELTRLDLSGTNAARLDESWGLPQAAAGAAFHAHVARTPHRHWVVGL